MTEGAVMDSGTESVKSILAENEIYLTLRQSEPEDLSFIRELQSIEEHRWLFKSLYSGYPLLRVCDLDTLYYYLLTRKIARMGNHIQYPDHDEDNLLTKLAADAAFALRETTGSAVAFINEHTREIFAELQTDYELKYATFDFIIEYQNECNPVFDYLCRKLPGLIISRYDDLRDVFSEHSKLFPVLFPPEFTFLSYEPGLPQEFKLILTARRVLPYEPGLRKVLDVWRREYKENPSLRPLIDGYADALCRDAWILFYFLSDDILVTAPVIRAVSIFLDQIHRAGSSWFSECVREAEKKLRTYLRKAKLRKAKSSDIFKIPKGDIHLGQWKGIDPRNSSLAELTHRPASEDGKDYESFLGLSPLQQSAGSGTAGFPVRIIYLSKLEKVNTGNFLTVLANQDIFDDYKEKVKDSVHFISGQASRSDELLEEDADMLIFLLESVSQNINARKSQKRQAVCYGASAFCCALMEKLLRPFYLPFLQKKFSIGRIQSETLPLIGSLSLEHRQGLVYFMSCISDNNGQWLGKEYRNRLAHWASDMNPRLMTPDWFARLLWLFTDVLNSVYLYYKHRKGSSATGN